ncbi:MAG: hypothetical protein AABO41_01975 [Acidobacteriota bacterium]
MAQALEAISTLCPLCDGQISLDVPDWRVTAGWRDVLEHREVWTRVADAFREYRSIDEAASRLSITSEVAERVLDFLCKELCGCRAATCVSCLDDYRSEL